jgi:signal transduction histidine kinase
VRASDITSEDHGARFDDIVTRFRLVTRSRPAIMIASSIVVCLAYIALATVSYRFVIPPSPNAVFWIPSGMTFALLVRASHARWLWPGWLVAVFVGEAAVARIHGVPLAVASAWGLTAVFVPAAGVWLGRRHGPALFGFRQIRDVVVLTAITVIATLPGALVAATAGVIGLGVPSFAGMAFSWWCSDALGTLLFAPVLLSWTTPQPTPVGGQREATALFACLLAVGLAVILPWESMDLARAMPAIALPFVAWAAIRFGPRATCVAMLIVDLFMVVSAVRGTGLYGGDMSPIERLFNVQLLVASLTSLVLMLAAAIEQQRAARVAAEDAIEIRDEFLSVAAHELHTPLTSLQLSAQMLAKSEQSTEIRARFLDTIQRQVRKLTALISDLLDTTRIREGRLAMTLEDVDLAAVVQEVAARAASLFERSGSTLTIRADGPVRGFWDRFRVEQIVTNLLSNAAKFGGGKPVELTVDLETGERARLVVVDHGIGISPERQPHIFGRFEQAVAARQYGGLGLGLYIVRSLAEQLGGSISVDSTHGGGSTFTVTLPLRGPATDAR